MQTPTSARRGAADGGEEDKHERLSFSPTQPLTLPPPLTTALPSTISSDVVTPRRRSTPTPLIIDSNAYGGKLSDEQKEERKRKKKSNLKRNHPTSSTTDNHPNSALLSPTSQHSTAAVVAVAVTPKSSSLLSLPPSSISSVRFAQRIAELRSPNTTSPPSSSVSSPLYRASDSEGSDAVGEDDGEDVELDLDMIGGDEADLSDDGELDSPPSLTFEESSMAGSGGHSHSAISSTASSSSSTASTVTAPPYALFLSFLSLAIAVLSMSAVGPMFLFLEKEKEVPPLLAACWRCQAMLIFMFIPTAIEWYHLSPEERSWSHLHVPPSPTLGEGGGELPQPAVGVSPKHRKGVPSMIEMNDVNRIDAFLDDQSAAAASADDVSSADGNKGGSRAAEAAVADDEEYASYAIHSSDTYPSSFAPRGTDGQHKRHLRISTVKVQSKMRLVHVSWYVLLVGLTWGASLALWVGALCFTSTARASLFGSTYPLILLVWMRWKGVQVSWMEMAGVVVALVGIVISEVVGYFTATERIIDEPPPPPAVDVTTSTTAAPAVATGSCQVVNDASTQLMGDLMMIAGSFINALNIVYASRARRVLRLFTYTLSTTTIVTLCLVALSALAEHSPADFSSHGLFGWLADRDMLLMISAFGFVVGCIGVLGQNYAVRYTSPVVFSTAQLLDPGLTAFMSWLAGLERLPSVSTGIGVLVVGVGIAGVVLGEYGRRREQESVHSYHPVSVQSDEQPH